MKKSGCLFLLLYFFICSTSNAQNAKEIFQQKLLVVENYHKGKNTIVEDLKSSAKFLAEITNIQYEVFDSYEMSKVTSKQNLKDWKKWFKKNKNLLYLDNETKKVKVKSTTANSYNGFGQ